MNQTIKQSNNLSIHQALGHQVGQLVNQTNKQGKFILSKGISAQTNQCPLKRQIIRPGILYGELGQAGRCLQISLTFLGII